MFDFRTQYDRVRVFTDPGCPIQDEFELRYDDNGVEYLAKSGEVDLYEQIQSHALSCDINYILSRYAQGDVDILQRRQAAYGDFSQMPSTYAELLNRAIDAENAFDGLPVSVKERFNNSMSEWLTGYGTPSWLEKMGLVDKKASEPIKEAVTDES